MSRTKGSKNKTKLDPRLEEKGNPMFQITPEIQAQADARTGIAPAAITDEDLALDRELEMISRNTAPLNISDADIPEVKKTIEPYTLISEFIENYKPAETIHELDEQVFQAKQLECDSIEATPNIIRYFCKKDYPDKVGYFIYHDIKVYIAGFFEQSILREKQTIEQKIFGASKIT